MKKVLFLFVFLCSILGAAAKDLQKVVFKVEQMVCVNCEAKVKRNIPYEKGVKNMKTDVENHTVTVTFDADVTNVANLQKGFAKFFFRRSLPTVCPTVGGGSVFSSLSSSFSPSCESKTKDFPAPERGVPHNGTPPARKTRHVLCKS